MEPQEIRKQMSENELLRDGDKASGTNLPVEAQAAGKSGDVGQDPEIEMVADDIVKFMDFPQLQLLMEDFYKLTNVGVAILDLKGNVLVATGWQDICTKFHRVNPEAAKNCVESDLKLSVNVKHGEYRIYKCKNNMWDMVTPIFIAGTHTCNLYLGQFLFKGEIPDLDVFSEQAERYGFDRDEYLAALERVPRWDREKVDTVMTFYSKFASLVGQLSYGNIRLSQALEHQKTLSESLRQNRNTLETILSASPVGIGHTRDRLIRWTNDTWLRMFGFENEQECIGQSARIIYPSDEEFEKVGAALYSDLEGQKVSSVDAVFQRKDGSTFEGHIRIRAVESDEGSRGHIAAISDISDRKRAEREIRSSEERLQLALEAANLGMWDVNLVTGKAVISSRTAEIIGYDPDEIDPTIDFWRTVIHPDDLPQTLELFYAHLKGKTDFFEHEYRAVLRDGKHRWIASRGKVVERDNSGRALRMAGTSRDITDIKKVHQEKEALYEQLLQAQKMEALGTLVGGIAHDFNNMLQIILGYSQILMLGRDEDDKDYKDLKNICYTAQEQADLVKRLLQFARKAEVNPLPLDMNRRVIDLANVMFKTFPKMIDTKLDLAPDLRSVMADQTQMDQVIMNLAINARDAMPNGGILKIATKNVIFGAEYRDIHGAKPGQYVAIFVSDTGGGIDENDLKRIFEPFFSTKQRGTDRGTGLGLSVVKGIVEQHHGYITCDSATGKGTEFKVFLPSIASSELTEEKQHGQI
ncbi:MAG: PocR ligand-binding domain-containing protein [Pseudomonadota bacterium]